MKSIEEIYEEVKNDPQLLQRLKEAQENNTVGEFLIGLGCTNVNEILLDYYKSNRGMRSLNLDELEGVVGGVASSKTYFKNDVDCLRSMIDLTK